MDTARRRRWSWMHLCMAAGPMALVLASAGAARSAEPDPADRQDFEFASHGFLGTQEDRYIRDDQGAVVRDLQAAAFADGPPIATINSSLQRHTQVLNKAGLFKVAENVWQVRGFDVTNLTVIRGKRGWILVDPLTSFETARAAMALVTRHLGQRPITAIVYTHSHIDHFGGAGGIIDPKDVAAGKIQIIAPSGFMKAVMSEWVIAGNAMFRRGGYQAATNLPIDPKGTVNFGIGQGDGLTPGTKHRSVIPPTLTIEPDNVNQTIDGVRIVFQLTLGTEAPSEMNLFFPDLHVLDLAENGNATMHNVLTPRGAEVRSAKDWADGLTEAQRKFGPQTDALIVSHGWPRFGKAEINDYIAKHRDAYKFLHDQTVRLMNSGLTGDEIAAQLKLPDVLAREWYNRGYYGSFSFNVRAVYQRYMGWYDGNPAHLVPIAPADEGRRYIEAIGGRARVMDLAARSAAAGDDTWAVRLLNHLVMSDAHDQASRDALAAIYERLGYAQENALWRNMYLSAALELREGLRRDPAASAASISSLAQQMPTGNLLDLFSVRLNSDKVGMAAATIDVVFPERKETFRITVRNQVLTFEENPAADQPDISVRLTRGAFLQFMATGKLDPAAQVTGQAQLLPTFQSWFETPRSVFPLVWREN